MMTKQIFFMLMVGTVQGGSITWMKSVGTGQANCSGGVVKSEQYLPLNTCVPAYGVRQRKTTCNSTHVIHSDYLKSVKPACTGTPAKVTVFPLCNPKTGALTTCTTVNDVASSMTGETANCLNPYQETFVPLDVCVKNNAKLSTKASCSNGVFKVALYNAPDCSGNIDLKSSAFYKMLGTGLDATQCEAVAYNGYSEYTTTQGASHRCPAQKMQSAKTCAKSDCCESAPKTKCGQTGVKCGSGMYQDPTKAAADLSKDLGPMKRLQQHAADLAACCSKKATCANATSELCGLRGVNASRATMMCTGGWSGWALGASCKASDCCNPVVVKCGTIGVKCAGGKYQDSAKSGNSRGADAGLAACCTAKAICAKASCPAGQKVNATAAEKMCTGGASTCVLKECCEADATKCGTSGVTCGGGTYQDSTKAAASRGSDKGVTACCTQKATCAIANCKVGDKRQVSVATFRCPGGVSSCVTDVGANPSCCVRDTRKDSTSKMDATVVVTDVSKFDLVKYKKAMETAIGADSTKNVTVTIKSIDIALVYDFSDTVTEIQAQTSIADSAGVPKTDVKVTLGRRLGNLQTGANLRRLAVTKVNAVITTADAAAATKVQGKVTSKAAGGFEAKLAAALKTAGVTVTVTEKVTPKISVKTEVIVRAKEGYVFKAPSAAAINTAAAAQGLTVAAEAVKVTVFGVTTTTKAPVPVPVPVAPSAVVVSDDSDGFPVWAIVIIILLVLGCVAVIVVGVLMSKKKAPAANKPPEEAPAAPAVVEEPKAPEPAAPAAPEPEAAAAEPEAAPAPVPEAAPAPVEEPPVVVPEALAPVEEQSPAVEENAASPDLNEIPIVLAEEAPVEESGLEISQIEEDARVPELSTVRGDVPAKSCFMCGC